MRRIGLTGGIGSGKSTVAAMLVGHGAVLVDADDIARKATACGGLAVKAIAKQFGPQAILADGSMNRDLMRELAFTDATAKRQLEAIIHPLVVKEALQQAEQALLLGATCLVFDVPLLAESKHWRQRLDQVLVVDCSEATQIARVMARNGWQREAVEKIMARQASRAQRLAIADRVIYNDELSLEALSLLVGEMATDFGL